MILYTYKVTEILRILYTGIKTHFCIIAIIELKKKSIYFLDQCLLPATTGNILIRIYTSFVVHAINIWVNLSRVCLITAVKWMYA